MGDNQNQSSTLQDIRSSGKIRVGYLPWDPAVIKNVKTGELTGIYPDMVRQIATESNLEVEWVQTSLSSFSAGLYSNQFDFSVGPTFITIPRSLAVGFTQPIGFVGNSGVVRADSNLEINNLEDLNNPNIRIAVLQGQAMEKYFRKYTPKADIIVIPGSDLTAPLLSVSSGKADVGFMNSLTVSRYVNEHEELRAVFIGDRQLAPLPLAWVTRENDFALKAFLNSSLDTIKYSGRLKEIQNEYQYRLIYDSADLKTLDEE